MPLLHPLGGSNLSTLATVVARHGPVPPGRWPQLAFSGASVLARTPFTLAEGIWARRKLARESEPLEPIFLLGHWRSGTTHLYNTLCKSGQFGYVSPIATGLPWDVLGLARLLRPLLERCLPSGRYIDRIPVLPDSPQEDEAALANMQPVSFYHGLYFPTHLRSCFDAGVFFDGCTEEEIELWKRRQSLFLRKMAWLQPGKPLLVKNPVYTARVALLREMYPRARYVHIHRNPYVVFLSMRNFYRRLLPALALQQFDLEDTQRDIDQLILESYPRMMRLLERDTADLPAGQYVELGYDRLVEEPLAALDEIYEGLGLPGIEPARPAFEAYLGSIGGYEKNRYELDEDVAERIAVDWAPWIERWGYGRPDRDNLAPESGSHGT